MDGVMIKIESILIAVATLFVVISFDCAYALKAFPYFRSSTTRLDGPNVNK